MRTSSEERFVGPAKTQIVPISVEAGAGLGSQQIRAAELHGGSGNSLVAAGRAKSLRSKCGQWSTYRGGELKDNI